MGIDYYLNLIDFAVQQKVLPMIHYIEKKYPAAVFDEAYSAKTKIPTYRHNGTYVSIACRRRYITIHFGNYDAVSIVTKSSEKVKGNVSCVNIVTMLISPTLQFIKPLTFALMKNKINKFF